MAGAPGEILLYTRSQGPWYRFGYLVDEQAWRSNRCAGEHVANSYDTGVSLPDLVGLDEP